MNEWLVSGITFGLLMSMALVPAMAEQPPEFSERKLTIASTDLDHLSSRMGSGAMDLQGVEGLHEVEVVASIYHYATDDIILSLEPINGGARIEAGFVGSEHGGVPPYMELSVRVPQHFAAQLKHGEGPIQVKNLQGMLTIENSSGDITVENTGGVDIQHQGGSRVQTRDIQGPVRVRQGS